MTLEMQPWLWYSGGCDITSATMTLILRRLQPCPSLLTTSFIYRILRGLSLHGKFHFSHVIIIRHYYVCQFVCHLKPELQQHFYNIQTKKILFVKAGHFQSLDVQTNGPVLRAIKKGGGHDMAELLNISDDSGPFINWTLKNGNCKIILLFFFHVSFFRLSFNFIIIIYKYLCSIILLLF